MTQAQKDRWIARLEYLIEAMEGENELIELLAWVKVQPVIADDPQYEAGYAKDDGHYEH